MANYKTIKMKNEKPYMWLSFREPKENLNLGCVIVKGSNLNDAVQRAWELNLNPGGEIAGFLLTEEQVKEENLEVERLYTKDELVELGYTTGL